MRWNYVAVGDGGICSDVGSQLLVEEGNEHSLQLRHLCCVQLLVSMRVDMPVLERRKDLMKNVFQFPLETKLHRCPRRSIASSSWSSSSSVMISSSLLLESSEAFAACMSAS